MNDDGLPMGNIEEEDDEDVDPFSLLGEAPAGNTAQSKGPSHELLEAFMDDDDDDAVDDTDEVGFGAESEEESKGEVAAEPAGLEGKLQIYKMLLETVWVDDILDPAEVNMLSRKREELEISFETHLELVREMLGE